MEEAAEVFQKAMPKAEAYLARARALVEVDDYDEAALNARKAIEQGCNLGEASIVLGRVFLAKEKYLEAAAQFKQAAADRSTAGAAWVWLGRVEELRGNVVGALECYMKALKVDPANEDLYAVVRRLQEQSFDGER